jgi:hypothetical protein
VSACINHSFKYQFMSKPTFTTKGRSLFNAIGVLAFAGIIAIGVSCNKNSGNNTAANATATQTAQPASAGGEKADAHQTLTSIATVAMLRTNADGRTVRAMFYENEQMLNVIDDALIAKLKDALNNNKAVQITFDPWASLLLNVAVPEVQDQAAFNARQTNRVSGPAKKIDLSTMSVDVINNPEAMGVINTTDPGLTPVIPDMQTAQRMFDYIEHQCCQLAGPYAIDHCITFQYCPDGCYARAHKMCWILNNTYKYATQKVFSFANTGHDELCVKAEKWGGCCINWWYHVAPLVTIKTPTGPKAYVFDPAMFDQPVTLYTWLHAQENPACVPSGDVPHVSMINIQPTASYSPANTPGTLFNTDASYSSTNSTLVSYMHLLSCP